MKDSTERPGLNPKNLRTNFAPIPDFAWHRPKFYSSGRCMKGVVLAAGAGPRLHSLKRVTDKQFYSNDY